MADPTPGCFGNLVWAPPCTGCAVRVECGLRQLSVLGTFLLPRVEPAVRGRALVNYATHVASATVRDRRER